MTYTEWRDELKNNLLSVSESERRRVLDYYAEAYADRREAGFSEREIIEYFGAPYDAAQRILCDRQDYSNEFFDDGKDSKKDGDNPKREEQKPRTDSGQKPRNESEEKAREVNDKSDEGLDDLRGNRLLFVLLCIIFAGPLFGLLMGMVGVTIGLCVAPFAVLVSGAGIIASGVLAMLGGEVLAGLGTFGIGLIILGVGIILMSVFTKIVKFIWKVWNAFFKWLKSLFGIKEKEKTK